MVRTDLSDILYDDLKKLGGCANIVDVCKYMWKHHEKELRDSGNLFYTWQYDIRWAATELRKTKKMKDTKDSPRGIWELK
ncbi:hypothetical protein SAMN04515656_1015 [Eubacterium aggregans]|uniref:Uncharacterized protein n=1 Tax=Eubacterium aggregans TaxID=81409 RepID=A0A1H3WPS5_9FIRM|nr:hypothetical protein [Eubacterium aggregans]SDZ88781.1 hypothetical protein SAMN04515656_1015 [Eubacterium aggregans]